MERNNAAVPSAHLLAYAAHELERGWVSLVDNAPTAGLASWERVEVAEALRDLEAATDIVVLAAAGRADEVAAYEVTARAVNALDSHLYTGLDYVVDLLSSLCDLADVAAEHEGCGPECDVERHGDVELDGWCETDDGDVIVEWRLCGERRRTLLRVDYDIDGATFFHESGGALPRDESDRELLEDAIEDDMASLRGSQFIPISPRRHRPSLAMEAA